MYKETKQHDLHMSELQHYLVMSGHETRQLVIVFII
jgi:hypothetical protein